MVLRAGLGPLHRGAQPAGEHEGEELLGVDVELRAEAAADVRGDDPDAGVGDAGDRGEDVTHEVRHLGGGVDGEPGADLVRHAHHRARLHRRGDHALLQVAPGHDDLGVGERGVDVAGGQRPGVAVVGAHLLVDDGGPVGEGVGHVDHGGQLGVLDVDEVGSVACGRGAGGEHDRDAVADVVDLVAGERAVVRDADVLGDRPAARDAGEELVVHVGGGEDRADPGDGGRGVGIDRDDPGVRQRAAHDDHVQGPGWRDVVGPGGPAGEQRPVLLALHAGPHPRCRSGTRLLRGGHGAPSDDDCGPCGTS